MVLGMVTTVFIPTREAKASDVKNVTMIAVMWQRCGYDRYGRPLLGGKHTTYDGVRVNGETGRFEPTATYPTYDALSGVFVPWQRENQVIWGRTGYNMPNCLLAIRNDGNGPYNRPVDQRAPTTWSIKPYLYAEVYLTVKAAGGESQLFDKRYIIMDELGQVWIDPEGVFNDCRYWDPADPKSAYYRSTTVLSGDGSPLWNDCRTNPKCLVDPSGDNNTQGPYIFNPNYNPVATRVAYPAPQYHERVYYWWWDEAKGIDRVWRLGWANMNDYLRRDAIAANGDVVNPVSGLVGSYPGSYYPGKPVLWNSLITDPVNQRWVPNDNNILGNDWDVGEGLASFANNEKYIDSNSNGQYDFGEPIFFDPTNNGFTANDTRLISYTIQWGGQAFNFREDSAVGPTDQDLQWFNAGAYATPSMNTSNAGLLKHANIPGLKLYGQIYLDLVNSGNNIVDPGDIRVSNINFRNTGFGLTSGGFFSGDAILMFELLKTSCSYTYNVHVESDLWTTVMQSDTHQQPEMIPSRTAAAFTSPNGDIYSMAQLINKSTALDVDGRTFYVPSTSFYDIRLQYREYIGLQIFLDNGVDNNLALGGQCYALSMSDDHVNMQAGEQFMGTQDVETAMDINLPLTDFPAMYLYYETNYNMIPGNQPAPPLPVDLRYGCGEPLYEDLNRIPYIPTAALQPNPAIVNPPYNPGVVNKGDRRMLDVTVTADNLIPGVASQVATYKAGSIVAEGDLDVGRPLISLEKGMTFYDEPHGCEQPNLMYDVGELIYFDPARAGSERNVRLVGWQNPADNGIESFTMGPYWGNNPGTAYNSDTPYNGTTGSLWRSLWTGYFSPWSWPEEWSTGGTWNTFKFSGNAVKTCTPPGGPPPWNGPMQRSWYNVANYAGSDRLHGWPARFNWSWPPNPYPYVPCGGLTYYAGNDANGDSPTTPGTGWNKYVLNFDITHVEGAQWSPGFGMYGNWVPLAAVYVNPATLTGYGATYLNSGPNDWMNGSYYNFWQTTRRGRLHFYRYDRVGANNYSRLVELSYIDLTPNVNHFPPGVTQRVQTTILNNSWRILIPADGVWRQASLTGGNNQGSIGFPQGNFYSYNTNWYYHDDYWDNVECYKVEKVPTPGDRERLLSPGHYVGMNGNVLRKNDAGQIVPSSTNTALPTAFKPFGYFYNCGTKLAAGELYDVQSLVGMVSMGKCGDPRFMDIEVLPGEVKVNVDINGIPADPTAPYHLKVEETSDIAVSIDPPPKPGEKYIVKFGDVYQSGFPAVPARTTYFETREANSFSSFDPTEVEIPKESFANTWLDDTMAECSPADGTTRCPQLALPWDFPLFNSVAPQGSMVEVCINGYISFMGLWGYCRYFSEIPNPYYWMDSPYSWYGAPDWTICPLGADHDNGYSQLSGQPVNHNLHCWVSRNNTRMKIRWETHSYYVGPNTGYPATRNFAVELYQNGNIRFTYGDMLAEDYSNQWSQAVSGIRGIGNAQIYETSMHGTVVQSFNRIDDILLKRVLLPADPGRPSGGTTDGDFMIGTATSSQVTPEGVMIPTPWAKETGNAYYKTVEITPENPVQHIEYTPYRGSCQPDGSRDPIKMEVFLERGGVAWPVPMDSVLSGERVERANADYDNFYEKNIYDPFWTLRPWTIKQYDERFKGDRTPYPIVPPHGIPTAACGLANEYDCYGKFNLYVEPENIKITTVDCVSPVDLRFPNIVLKLYDDDNPKDINDPAGMEFSTPWLQLGNRGKLVANVNAHGAGIKYLASATNDYGDWYCIQVNDDGTYSFWRVYEPGQDGPGAMRGALDPTDWVYSIRNYDNGIYVDDAQGYGQYDQLPWKDTDGFLSRWGSNLSTALDDRDCSTGQGICDVCHLGSGFPRLGDITKYDRMGRFNNTIIDNQAAFIGGNNGRPHGYINTFGIPCLISNWSSNSEGGEIMVPIQPQNTETPLTIRVYLNNVIFDYNSALSVQSLDLTDNPTVHPPYFVYDDAPGIDYCGTTTIKVTPAANLNFSEFRWVDNGLRFSLADYTAGATPTSRMDRPTPQLKHFYDPVCYNNKTDTYCYPGGQSHVARAFGSERQGGFNAYPAIHKNMWKKLGTEFYPLTDYSMYFSLISPTDTNRAQEWDFYSFDAQQLQYNRTWSFLLIDSIEVKGPFMRPMRWYRPQQNWDNTTWAQERLSSEYSYNGIKNVPIRYDTSGYIKVDAHNWQDYQYRRWYWSEGDWTNIIDPATDYRDDRHSALGVSLPTNSVLRSHRDLVYYSSSPQISMANIDPFANSVFVFDEIIPTQPGNIEIKVKLSNGDVKIYQDCCQDPPTDGIDVHALKIDLQNKDIEERGGIYVDNDVTFKVVLSENEKINPNTKGNEDWDAPCNDAVVYAWQDRGIYDPAQLVWKGAGDGWVTGAPKSSVIYNQGTQFLPEDDKDGDGKISFKSGETEILGTYDLVTNTWIGAYIDARTFQRNNGEYNLECAEKNACQPDTVGFDFGAMNPSGRPMPPGIRDHVVGWDETLPIWITAYKYGDDNNDRSFRPLYDSLPDRVRSNSHEVYIAGTRSFEVMPKTDLQMSYGPEPLTAGMTPELQNPAAPLTFTFTDAQGKPVDFTQGIPDAFGRTHVEERDIWMHCFQDPHPDNTYYYGVNALLPQYYWLRTDLHNWSGSIECNALLYSSPIFPFTPIGFSVKRDDKGQAIGYQFTGFCANDQGEFEVYAYTPDRKHGGKITVKVKQPHVEYAIRNTESNQTLTVRGNAGALASTADPDFVMTAGDERIYQITAKCWDAQGALIKGVAKEVSVCSGTGQDTARFTPFVTRPDQWKWAFANNHPGVAQYGRNLSLERNWTPLYYMIGEGNRFRPWLALDITNDGKIDPILGNNSEIHLFDSAHAFSTYQYYRIMDMCNPNEVYRAYWTASYVNYNTTNFRYDDYSFDVTPSWDLPPSNNKGWGYGSIYNNPYEGGYVFADLDASGYLNFSDAISFNQNGEASFYYYADDKMKVGGLCGNNLYCNSFDFGDLVGSPMYYGKLDPSYTRYRFKHGRTYQASWFGGNDGSFRMDWDAMPDNLASVAKPIVKLFEPATGEELGKDLINPDIYDVIYGKENHFIVRAYPADARDLKLKENSIVQLTGDRDWLMGELVGSHEASIVGKLQNSEVDPNAVETIMSFTPTGTGSETTSLDFYRNFDWNKRANNVQGRVPISYGFFLSKVADFDSCKGLDVKAEPLNKILRLGQSDSVLVTVTEYATGYRYEGANVTLKSEDGAINLEGKTNAQGEVMFNNVKPESQSKVIVKATLDGRANGYTTLFIDVDLTPPSININPFPAITNKSAITFEGDVTKGSTLKVGNVNADVDANGKWKATYNFAKEGEQMINLVAVGPNGATRSVTIRLIFDKTPPKVMLPTEEEVVAYLLSGDGKTLRLSGRVDPGSEVTLTYDNGQSVKVTVVNDYWITDEFPVNQGVTLNVQVIAKDAAGNISPAALATYKVPKMTTIELTMGSTSWVLNGKIGTLLIQPPTLAGANQMIPVEELAQALGITVSFDGTTKVTFSVGTKSAECTIGSTAATLDGVAVTLATAPVVATGKSLVPASFLVKVLDLEGNKNSLSYDAVGRTLKIVRVW